MKLNRHTAAKLRDALGMLEFVMLGEIAAIRRAIDQAVLEAEEKMPEGADEPAAPLIRAGAAGDTVGIREAGVPSDSKSPGDGTTPPLPSLGDIALRLSLLDDAIAANPDPGAREVATKFLLAARVFTVKGEAELALRKLEAVENVLGGVG